MMASEIAVALAPQVARDVRWLSVLHACPAFPQIQEKAASDRCPASQDTRVLAFLLQVFAEA